MRNDSIATTLDITMKKGVECLFGKGLGYTNDVFQKHDIKTPSRILSNRIAHIIHTQLSIYFTYFLDNVILF